MTMKLSICLLLAVVAAASADQGFYQPQPAAQSAHQPAPSSYTHYDYDYPPQKEGWLDRLLESNRRQDLEGFIAGLGGPGTVFSMVVVATIGVGIVATVFYLAAVLSSSGRGLDTDAWELDHSVWMDQLQKDFEDSWTRQ